MNSARSAVDLTEPDRPVTRVSLVLGRVRRLSVLRQTVNRKRLRKAWELSRQYGFGVLWTQLRLHIAYRSRLADPDEELELPPTSPTPEPYEEAAWPADRPLVSVVIPCFNYGEFVQQAIDSVLAQTFRDFEIIVVEGGSTDNGATRAVLNNLAVPGVTVLYRDERHPVGDNRNFGIRIARGKYICCLDADDLLRPTYLEKAVFLLEHYGYDVVSTAVCRFGAVEDTYGVMAAPDLADLLSGNHVTTCAVFRRSLWERAGGYQDTLADQVFLHEDWRFWIRLACLGARFANITGEQLFLYRTHVQASLSNAPGLLPNEQQGELIQRAEQALITPMALNMSHQRMQRCLRSTAGARNMVRSGDGSAGDKTILLAVPFLVLGGAERLLSEVLRHLRGIGYRIVIVSTLPAPAELGDTTPWFEEVTSEIYHLPRFLSEDRWDDFLAYLLAAKQVHLLWIVGSAFAYRALPQIKQTYPDLRVVDLLFNTVGHTENNRRFSGYIDLNLVESDGVRRWLTDRGELPQRIRTIPSGVDLQRFVPCSNAGDLRERLQLEPDAFVVGFSGRLSEEKAPLAVLRIAAQLPADAPIRVVVTGTGPLAAALCNGIRKQRLEHRVRFLGVVPDIRDCLACFDVLILPSKIDGRPTVVLEALAMGVPVIASAVGGLPELVQHGVTGFLCEPGNAATFAGHIAALQADPDRLRGMRAAARKFADENLGIARMTADYASAFQALLSVQQGAEPGFQRCLAYAGRIDSPHAIESYSECRGKSGGPLFFDS